MPTTPCAHASADLVARYLPGNAGKPDEVYCGRCGDVWTRGDTAYAYMANAAGAGTTRTLDGHTSDDLEDTDPLDTYLDAWPAMSIAVAAAVTITRQTIADTLRWAADLLDGSKL